MRPTRFGIKSVVFYLVMLGAFFAAPYSNLFFLLLAFLTLAGAFGAAEETTERRLQQERGHA